MSNINRFRRERAKQLRSNATEPEQRLWRALKKIPVYGSHHSQNHIAAKDEARTRWLESEGYRVVRFWNTELSENMNGVLDTIYAALYGLPQSEALALPTPPRPDGRPSPSRGG